MYNEKLISPLGKTGEKKKEKKRKRGRRRKKRKRKEISGNTWIFGHQPLPAKSHTKQS